MRKLLIAIAVVVALIAGTIVYLSATTPTTSPGVRFPLTPAQRSLLSLVPPTADSFAFAPDAAVLHAKLLANRVTSEPVAEWSRQQRLPRPWMVGGADLVAWRQESGTSYILRLDGFRAAFLRLYLLFGGAGHARLDGNLLFINVEEMPPSGGATELEALASGLPPGDAIVIQREGERGAFPPIGRPSATSIRLTEREIIAVSHARATEPPSTQPMAPRFLAGAMLSATFADPPAVIDDLNRIFGTRVSTLLEGGGSVVLYDVDTGTLLPRPNGLIVLPSNETTRAGVENIGSFVKSIGDLKDNGREIMVSVDRSSLPKYERESFLQPTFRSTEWAARVDPKQLVPILEKLGDSTGLRLATPRLFRSVRDLRRWIRHLALADSIEAARSRSGGIDELAVRISSK